MKIGKLKEEAWCARGKTVDSGCVVVAAIKASQRLVVQRGWSLHGRTLTLSGLRQIVRMAHPLFVLIAARSAKLVLE